MTINDLAKKYYWFSTKFYCHETFDSLTQSARPFELIRIKFTNTLFDETNKCVYAISNVLSNHDNIVNRNIRIQLIGDRLLISDENELPSAPWLDNPSALDKNGAIFVSGTTSKYLVMTRYTRDSFKCQFFVKDNDIITPDNVTSSEGQVILTDDDVEPVYNSDGYILPSIPFSNII